MTEVPRLAQVALDVPLPGPFDYRVPDSMAMPAIGQRVVVPWGKRRLVGLVQARPRATEFAPERIRPILRILDEMPALPASWWQLVEFAAAYYHRSAGEIALPALPKPLRTVPGSRSRDPVSRWRKRFDAQPRSTALRPTPRLTDAQRQALEAIADARGFAPFVLHGATGSGKTEVYLGWFTRVLQDPGAQVLLLVPEIALTPALVALVSTRFPQERICVMHSGLPDALRAAHWLAAFEQRARIVVGTRLAVLTPLPGLAAIVVDEEHDPSYKQQEGVHYSARDLAVTLASQRRVPVVLGSATPSLETWNAVRRGRYRLLGLPERIEGAPLPKVHVIGTRQLNLRHGLAPAAIEAIAARLQRGEQSLVFLNRRGFAPVLCCPACGWLSRCDDCTAYRVLHRARGAGVGPAAHFRLICHHCGRDARVPRGCPDCGNVDLQPLGRGTQRLEDALKELFPEARIARVDRDIARRRGETERVLTAAHAGELDILIGTQMLAKGHDFRRLSLVVVVDPDAALFAADFRAPERLFATLMQVAGRAGRSGIASEVLLQTRYVDHPLFAALAAHDYEGFAARLLADRRQAGLPPFVHQALLRVEARTLDAALEFLKAAVAESDVCTRQLNLPQDVLTRYDPVPMPLMRKAGQERAQLLIESGSRPALHRHLESWITRLRLLKPAVRWQLEVDPIEI
ncbi:MAG: primosomal protein N' [Burkholderiales bacterium]|nr:MAG: primosomal protein N' [Burkholderiales bacterium]